MTHGGPVTEGGVTRVTMPQLGESVTEGQISRWLKAPGDRVEKYEPIVEVITDKVNAEVPSPVEGVLTEINAREGETVAVGTLICSIGAAGATAEAESPAPDAAAVGDASPSAGALSQPGIASSPPSPPRVAAGNGAAAKGRDRAGRASPAVRRLASEHNLDLSVIEGTGIGGRVSKRDVEQFIASGGAAVPAVPLAAPAGTAGAPPAPAPQAWPGDELVPLNPVRKAIAEHMVRSRHTSPHAWCAAEIDMTSVVALRKAERESFRTRESVDLTYVPFVIKAAVEALKEHPEMNATWTAQGILRRKRINISVAVGAPGGLVVPVIHDADMLSIAGLAHRLDDIVTRARAGQLKLADVEAGTFCVNNPGTFGTVISAPIINQPQAGIMTMEAIVKRAVVLPGDVIGIRSMMFSGLSFDHRVVDGLEAAAFLGAVKGHLEAMGPATPIY